MKSIRSIFIGIAILTMTFGIYFALPLIMLLGFAVFLGSFI